jgi:hypothetical protein
MNLVIAVQNLKTHFYEIDFDTKPFFPLILTRSHFPGDFAPNNLYDILHSIALIMWPASKNLLNETTLKIIGDFY